jgi:hypothetical protein
MARSSHLTLLAVASKAKLEPHGCTEYDKNRIWIKDRGWYLGFVEFQRSRHTKALYLNVSAHFLWTYMHGLTFDYGHRVGGAELYQSDEQFSSAVTGMVQSAVDELVRIEKVLDSPAGAVRALPRSTNNQRMMRYHRGIAHALSGDWGKGRELLESLAARPQEHPEEQELNRQCQSLLDLIEDRRAFVARIESLVNVQRGAFGLGSRFGFRSEIPSSAI